MSKKEKINKILNAILVAFILLAVLIWGLNMWKYGRFEIYTIRYDELCMQLEWDNYLICRWVVPLH